MKRGLLLRSLAAGLACVLAVDAASAETPSSAPASSAPASSAPGSSAPGSSAPASSAPAERSETSVFTPPKTVWPVYVLGAVGLVGLGTAAVFGGLKANASHGVDVSTQALLRNGQSPATCDARPVEVYYAEICAHLGKNKRLADSHDGIFLPSLVVGLSATALAIGWFFLAPKEAAKAEGSARPRVVPWMGATGGGATLEGRF